MSETSVPTQAQKNERLANDLKAFVEKHRLGDISIYFNERCYRFSSTGTLEVQEGVVGSTYFEYANDETVSMSFEGTLNHIINYGEDPELYRAFSDIFARNGCYFELGYAWSLSVYY